MQGDRLLVLRLLERKQELEKKKTEIHDELRLIEEMLSGPGPQAIVREIEQQGGFVGGEAQEGMKPESIDEEEILSEAEHLEVSTLPVWRAAQEVLRHVGHPLPRELLSQAIQAAGKQFGGETPGNSLAAHVSQHPEHLVAYRGWVYLAEWLSPLPG